MQHPAIKRSMQGNQSFIRKKLRSPNELQVMKYLEEISFPAPRLVELGTKYDLGDSYFYMQDLGQIHLESSPGYYEAAFLLHKRMNSFHYKSKEESITTGTLISWVEQAPSFIEICDRFHWSEQRKAVVLELWQKLKKIGPLGEPLVFSHGDYHPRNIMIYQGEPVPIDWEKAGLHSIYQDIYALLDMCYPDAEACLLPEERERLFQVFAEEAGLLHWQEGYTIFRLLYRLNELIFISNDYMAGIREARPLLEQAEFVYRDICLTQI